MFESNHINHESDACGVGFVYRPVKSNQAVCDALGALNRMEHRGACGADGITGDGAGILTEIPWQLLAAEGLRASALGMIFLPQADTAFCRQNTERLVQAEGFTSVCWRKVPLDSSALGPLGRATCPVIEQLLLGAPGHWTVEKIEQKLLFARKKLANFFYSLGEKYSDFYVASLSSRTVVYKGMVRSYDLARFYKDLSNVAFTSQFAVYHRRFSTNTMPKWRLAQPFRMLGHNGEINTLLGNRNWMKCREMVLDLGSLPLVSANTSDSGSLDNALELLVKLGRSPESALMQLIPDAAGATTAGALKASAQEQQDLQIAGFYQYFSGIQEPWDGPALIVYSDGLTVGAKLDRNGMRPARYTKLKDGSVFLSSETGVIDLDELQVVQKGRLGPGQMLMVDIESGQVSEDRAVKIDVAYEQPYAKWVVSERITLGRSPFADQIKLADSDLIGLQTAYGYGNEDIVRIIVAMAATGHETVYSMGDDTPLAVLSSQPRLLYDYFKQRFAQVTNPPIDHLREKLVMSLDTYLGAQSGWLKPSCHGARLIHLSSPILNEGELRQLQDLGTLKQITELEPEALTETDVASNFASQSVSLLFNALEVSLDSALSHVVEASVQAVENGKTLLILSDRGVDSERAAIPALMAVGAVHHQLIRRGLRLSASLIVETGQCWTTHQFACLFAFGAQAVCPYMALEIVRHSCADAEIKSLVELSNHDAQANFRAAVEEGLQKVLSKMGISSLTSYIGAQIFECIGLSDSVVQRCFTDTPSRIGGLEIEDIEKDVLAFHRKAFPFTHKRLINYGMMSSRPDGEYHGNNPKIVRALHTALGISQKVVSVQERQEEFKRYSALVRERPPLALRDMLTFKPDRPPVALDEVEPAADIVKRFCTGGMSLGALSKEAHEVLAIAMNRLGAKSNSGEGGEDPLRYYPIEDVTAEGTSANFPGLRGLQKNDDAGSAVRQVASARFGVTPEYLATARQLEIKIAQGAKPGEGGQLPGHKVSEYIAKLRRAKAGASLISPPPHHDIYSIEDLSQLIFDLRQVSRQALISVKLVAEVGIGAVAAGVAKANADIIQVSGNDGGTGASALSSIKHAGAPWELGLTEVHQSLLHNDLRHRVLLRVDGGLRSGWEVVMAAMMGANEYGFGSIALIAEGCIMARVCHTNNCPVGITSQKEKLRETFTGVPDQIVEFFMFIAEEVRYTLAELGYRSLHDVLGRTDLLQSKSEIKPHKVERVNLNYLLGTNSKDLSQTKNAAWKSPSIEPHRDLDSLTDYILSENDVQAAIKTHGTVSRRYAINNTDRSVGARLGGTLAKLYGDNGFGGHIELNFNGSAGQSFGAFIVDNVSLSLTGEANDYVGKGMSGGEIAIKFAALSSLKSWQNVIVGNTCLYGATGGALFCAGQAGERFAVRNSGAVAVVEGSGNHCCEYMTGGAVVVLGQVGRNFGAGMTGGLAFVLDAKQEFSEKYCGEPDKKLQRVSGLASDYLHDLIEQHYLATASVRAKNILDNYAVYLPQFWQIVPQGEEDHVYSFATSGLAALQLKIG